jgi:hypothetical protein
MLGLANRHRECGGRSLDRCWVHALARPPPEQLFRARRAEARRGSRSERSFRPTMREGSGSTSGSWLVPSADVSAPRAWANPMHLEENVRIGVLQCIGVAGVHRPSRRGRGHEGVVRPERGGRDVERSAGSSGLLIIGRAGQSPRPVRSQAGSEGPRRSRACRRRRCGPITTSRDVAMGVVGAEPSAGPRGTLLLPDRATERDARSGRNRASREPRRLLRCPSRPADVAVPFATSRVAGDSKGCWAQNGRTSSTVTPARASGRAVSHVSASIAGPSLS